MKRYAWLLAMVMPLIILERVPISMDDAWPELLNHYTNCEEFEKRSRGRYDDCLTELLKEDFFFYRTYDTALYFNLLGTGGAKALLARVVISARDLLIIEGAKELGRRYEHAKWVVSYYPFGCKCCYFSPRFASLTPVSTECLQIKPLIGCSFFMDPTEVVLYDHLFEKGGFDSWVELQINPECFRVVEGEVLGTFEEVYCTLLLDHLRDGIESFKNREFGAAYQFLKEALALKEDQEVYLYMAYTEMILDEEANLEKTLAESLSLKEDNEVYRQVYREYPEAAEIAPYREGLLLYELNRPDEAQTAVREYLRKYPRGKDAPWGPMRQKI